MSDERSEGRKRCKERDERDKEGKREEGKRGMREAAGNEREDQSN